MKIGVYGIFIKDYIVYIDQFLEGCTNRFMKNHNKKFFIIIDKDNEDKVKELSEVYDIEYRIVKYIGWPYETLYRYVYFDFFDMKNVRDCNYMYFLNSNILFRKECGEEMLPDETGYVFTFHSSFHKIRSVEKCNATDKNRISKCYIPKDTELKYIIGGLFGCESDKFIKLSNFLRDNIFENERIGYIAKWNDETHLNYYVNVVLKNNVKYLSPLYHGFGRQRKNFVDFEKKEIKINCNHKVRRNKRIVRKNVYNIEYFNKVKN